MIQDLICSQCKFSVEGLILFSLTSKGALLLASKRIPTAAFVVKHKRFLYLFPLFLFFFNYIPNYSKTKKARKQLK